MKEGLIAVQVVITDDYFDQVFNFADYYKHFSRIYITENNTIIKSILICYDFSTMLTYFNAILMKLLYVLKYKVLLSSHKVIKFVKHIFNYNRQNKIALMNLKLQTSMYEVYW